MATNRPSVERKALIAAAFVFLVLCIIPAGIGYYYHKTDVTLTGQVTDQALEVADLTASAVRIKLDHLVTLGSSFEAIPSFSQSIIDHNWTQAANIARDLENDNGYYDPYIDRITIYDTEPIMEAAYPALEGGIGTMGASTRWFTAIEGGKQWFVDGVVERLTNPRIKVVNIAFPIYQDGVPQGFFILQTGAQNYLEFSSSLSLGSYGFADIVDQYGNLVADPHSSPFEGQPTSDANDPAVKAALAGNSGTMIETDPATGLESLVAYKDIPTYGWATIIRQPYDEAFGPRDTILQLFKIAIISTLAAAFALAYLTWAAILREDEKPKRRASKRKGFTLIELLVVIAIIAVLSVVVILTLNPAELLKQARDSSRISDLGTLKTATSLYIIDANNPNIASSSFGYSACYVSSAAGNGTTTAKCGTFLTMSGINASTTSVLYRKTDSSGWLPVNFSQLSYGSPFGSLPVDPSNNANYYYSYAATSSGGALFEFDAFMESNKYNNSTTGVIANDGGNNSAAYEVGNKAGLNL